MAEDGASLTTSGTQGRRVLTSCEYAHVLREEYRQDKALDNKLYEIEKMIVGLSLE